MSWFDRILHRDPLRGVGPSRPGDQGGSCIDGHADYREWRERWLSGLSEESAALGLANEANEPYVYRVLKCEAAYTEKEALPLRMELYSKIKQLEKEGWEVHTKGVRGEHPLHAHAGPALPGLWIEMRRLKTEKELRG